MRMPPKGKLPEATIATLEQWVRGGAVDAASGRRPPPGRRPPKKPAGIDFEAARSHWAYQPIRRPAIPAVTNADWPRSPVDAFVLARLEAAGLTPSPPADRRTLLRRVYYDLIGLPPTAAEVEAFENDRSPDAFARVVDRLLASPHYGERWGRHWLDVARYADTKDGVLMFGDDRVRPFAYTYRDYVIRAFNEDLGFDRFVHDQLAADVVAPKDQPWRLAAMGFLTLGKGVRQQHPRPDRRPDRHGHPRLPGPDRRLRPLPRPQVRRDPDGRLLLALRGLRQQRGPARAAADRPAGRAPQADATSRSRPRPSGASSDSSSTASTSSSPRPRGSGRPTTWSGPPRRRPTRSRRRSSSSRWPPRTCGRRSSRGGGGSSRTGPSRTIPSSARGTT